MNKLNKIFLSLLVTLSLSKGAAIAQEQNNFSLQQCVDYALSHQSSYLNAQIDEDIARKKVQELLGAGLPQLNGSGSLNDYIAIPTSLIPGEFFGAPAGTYIPVKFGTQYNASGGFDASQLIFDGKYFVGVQASKALQELTQKMTNRTKIETISTVTKAYYTALIANKRMELLNTNVDRIAKLASDTKTLYDNGFVEKLDLDKVNVALSNLKTEQEKVSKLVDLSSYLLKYQMGMDVNAKLTLTDKLEDQNFESVLSGSFNPQDRVEMQMLNSQKTLYTLQGKSYKVGYIPSLVAFGSYSWSAQRTEFNFLDGNQKWYPVGIIGLKLSVPIFDGLQKARYIQESNLNLQKNANDILNLTNGLNLQYLNAKTQLQNATQTVQSQKDNMDLAESVYNATKKKYEEGVGSNLELTTAQSALKEAETNYLNALYDALIAKTDYLVATGQLK
ncbi:MAG TPA: TolC family protein [Bacteroidetes bacterium]|nr:TolC family protein [Bacteroidota bacterium]